VTDHIADHDVAELAVEAEPDRWRRWFLVFVTVGIVLALVLGFREVVVEPVIRLDDVRGSDRGVLPVQAQVLALNSSDDETFCVEVEITAADRDGRSLSTKLAEPTTGDGQLAPGRSANFVARFDELTQQEIDEELDGYYAFVASRTKC
jgi:hypothetical protein